MTVDLRLAKIKLLKAQVERREVMIKTYESLAAYWKAHRMIGMSDKLNQTEEFIKDTARYCEEMIASHTDELYHYNKKLDILGDEQRIYEIRG